MGGQGSGWFASAGHVPRIKRDSITVPKYNPKAYKDHYALMKEKKINDDEYESIRQYIGLDGSHRGINKALRAGDDTNQWINNEVKRIRSAMNNNPLEKDVVVYRGVPDRIAQKAINAGKIHDEGFWSTSADFEISSDHFAAPSSLDNKSKYINFFRIVAKKGEPGLYITSHQEEEFLLSGGRFRVKQVVLTPVVKIEGHPVMSYGKTNRIIELERITKSTTPRPRTQSGTKFRRDY